MSRWWRPELSLDPLSPSSVRDGYLTPAEEKAEVVYEIQRYMDDMKPGDTIILERGIGGTSPGSGPTWTVTRRTGPA